MEQLISILRVAEQGLSHPYYCMDALEKHYYCKGNQAGRQVLCSE